MSICPACRQKCRRTATKKPGLDCLKCDFCSSTFFTKEEDDKIDSFSEGNSYFSKENLETAKKMEGGQKIPYACKCISCGSLMMITKKCKKVARPIFHIRCHNCGTNGFVNPAYWGNLFEDKKK